MIFTDLLIVATGTGDVIVYLAKGVRTDGDVVRCYAVPVATQHGARGPHWRDSAFEEFDASTVLEHIELPLPAGS